MPQIVVGADGIEREFPDGMTETAMDAVFKSEGTQRAGGILLPGLTPGIAPALLGGAVVGGTAGAQRVRKVPDNVKRAAGKFLARRIPGVGGAMDAAEALQEAVGQPAVPAAPRSSGRLPASVVEITEADIARFPQLKNYSPGETISRKTLEQIKLEAIPGSVESRAKKLKEGSYQARGRPTRPIKVIDTRITHRTTAPAPTPESPGAGRGASRPELERRAAQMAAARARRAPAPSVPLEAEDDISAALRRSLETAPEQRMISEGLKRGVGVAGAGRARGLLRTGTGGALGLLLALMDTSETPEQMDEAQRIYREATMNPTLRRLLEEAPQGF